MKATRNQHNECEKHERETGKTPKMKAFPNKTPAEIRRETKRQSEKASKQRDRKRSRRERRRERRGRRRRDGWMEKESFSL